MDITSLFNKLPCGVAAFEDIADGILDVRSKNRLPYNAKSVITVLFPYYLGEDAYRGANVSRYAVPRDYHLVAGDILRRACEILKNEYPGYTFLPFIDSSPLPEVRCAALAGLGVIGKNGMLINEKYGSWVFIGEIVTDLTLPTVRHEITSCISCGACEKNCPGNALRNGRLSKENCLSHQSQLKGELSPETVTMMETTGCIWGCDLCQTVCPMNKNAAVTPLEEFIQTAKKNYQPSQDIRDRAYAWRGKAVMQRNFNAAGKAEEYADIQ